MKKLIAVILIGAIILTGAFIRDNFNEGEPTITSVTLHEEINGREVFLVR